MNLCLIDTNILLRSAQPTSSQHEMTLAALERLRAKEFRLVLVPQVIYEYWTAATRPVSVNGLGMTRETVETSLNLMLTDLVLMRDERGVFDLWRLLVSQYDVSGKTTHDVRLVAAMKRHNIKTILTFNSVDFKRFAEIEVLTPDNVLSG
jgi:Predicted nucleic acid-binding protein, contains PIN domain